MIEQNRYPDRTAQVESLFAFIEQTIESELVEELSFLASYDRTKRAMQRGGRPTRP